jgi:hypothetical protein
MNPTPKPGKRKPGAKEPALPFSKNRKKQAIVGSLCLAILLFSTWYLWPQSQMDKVRAMQEKLYSMPKEQRDQMSDEERRAQFNALRAAEDKLTGVQLKQLREEWMQKFKEKKANARSPGP